MLNTQFKKHIYQLHISCWYDISKTGDGKWILWMTGEKNLWCEDNETEMQMNLLLKSLIYGDQQSAKSEIKAVNHSTSLR